MRKLMAFAAIMIAVVGLAACGDTYNGGDVVTNNIILGQNGPTTDPSPASGCPVAGVIDSIRVNPFGYDCQSGVPRPANSSGLLPVGCVARVTATPKDSGGNDVPANVHGQGIVWATTFGASLVQVDDDPSNSFNKNVTARSGVTSGEFRIEATVCGKTGSWNGRICSGGACQ